MTRAALSGHPWRKSVFASFSACLLVIALASAQPVPAQTQEEATVLPRIVATLCLDMVEALDGCETAVLITSDTLPDRADLVIFSNRRASVPGEILATVRGIAFDGAFFGQSPTLEAGPDRDLLLHEEQSAFGRTPWFQTLSIRYLDAGFIVAGHAYATYDRAIGGSFSCTVDLVTGIWTVQADRVNPESGETTLDLTLNGRVAATLLPLADASLGPALPPPCEAALADWANAVP